MLKNIRKISPVIILLILLSCSQCERKRSDLPSLLPQDTQNLILIPKTELFISNILSFLKLFENGAAFDALKKEIELASQKLGVNLLDKRSIIEAGFDPEGSFAAVSIPVSIEGKIQNVNLLIMPYSNRSRAENTLSRLSREREKTEIFKTKSYKDAKMITAIRQGPKGEKPVLIYAFYRGYIIYGIPDKAEVAIKKIVDTKEQGSLIKNPVYTSLLSRVKNGQLYFFINSGKNIESTSLILNKEMKELLSSVKENFNGLMISFNISDSNIRLDSFTALSQKSMESLNRYLNRSSKEEIEKLLYIIPDEPFLLAKLNLNYKSIYSLMKEEDPYQMMIINKRLFGPMMKYIEIDVEKDILPLLKGALVYAVSLDEGSDINKVIESGFKGETFNKFFNVFYSMSLADEKASGDLMARFNNSMKEKGQRVESIRYKNIDIASSRFGAAYNSYWYIDEGNFYAYYSDKKPENVIRKPEKDKKVNLKIPADVYNLLLDPSSQMLYISFTPLKKMINRVDESSVSSIASTGIYKFAFVLIKEFINRLVDLNLYLLPSKDGVSVDINVSLKNK